MSQFDSPDDRRIAEALMSAAGVADAFDDPAVAAIYDDATLGMAAYCKMLMDKGLAPSVCLQQLLSAAAVSWFRTIGLTETRG